MRHFRADLDQKGLRVIYHCLGERPHATLERALAADLTQMHPEGLIMAAAGEYRVQRGIEQVVLECGRPLSVREDRHFLMSLPGFTAWSAGRKTIRTEHLYRHLRERTALLIDRGRPLGGRGTSTARPCTASMQRRDGSAQALPMLARFLDR